MVSLVTLAMATDPAAPSISQLDLASIRRAKHVKVDPDIALILDRWIEDEIKRARQVRGELMPRIEKWRRTMSGKRATPTVRTGSSNISVPFSLWVRTGTRARVDEGIFDAQPILTFRPAKGRETPDDPAPARTADALGKLMIAEILNPRGLAGRVAMTKVEAEAVDFGASAWKIIPQEDDVRNAAPVGDAKGPTRIVVPGGVKWEFVSLLDLIWVEGYGTDVNAMPLIGHEFDQTWGEIQRWGSLGHYDPDVVDEVQHFYDQKESKRSRPAALRDHPIVEIHLDYDVDGDGVPESLIISWHREARKRLRTIWQYTSEGRRPFVLVNFDLPNNLTSALGQGAMEKLEGTQDEIDAIHNIAIEGAKRAGAFINVLKAGTQAEKDFGGDEELLPGDNVVTENPDEDVVPKAMGDPGAAMALLQLELHSRGYATEIFGMGQTQVGNVEAGKRVSAQVGMSSMREGRVPIKATLTSFAAALAEACYITIDLWRTRLPVTTLASALTPEQIDDLRSSVFTLTDAGIRSNYLITVNAEDAATLQEAKKNELMAINQFLFGVYDRMERIILAIANPQMPPAAKAPLILLAERMERGVEALLRTLDSIPNPEELLVRVDEMKVLLEQEAQSMPTLPTPPPPPGAGIPGADLGGGVT